MMIYKIVIIHSLILICEGVYQHRDGEHKSLTGYMTDVQNWVDERGVLINKEDKNSALDLSADPTPLLTLRQKLESLKFTDVIVKYLSLARCRLTTVPKDFHIIGGLGRELAETVEYITFYGNDFLEWSAPGEQYDIQFNATDVEDIKFDGEIESKDSVWSIGLKESVFPELKELDLRACSIKTLSGHIFSGMPKLEALYLGENNIRHIHLSAFVGLNSLKHLDLSANEPYDDNGNKKRFKRKNLEALRSLEKLASLDLSMTKLSQQLSTSFSFLGKKLVKLSLFDCGISNLAANAFNTTSLKILELSKNNWILRQRSALQGIEDTLQVLYVRCIGLVSLDIFENFTQLEILDVSFNEIWGFNPFTVRTLTKLQILNLDNNRMPAWTPPFISLMPNLKLLQIRDNNINLITKELLSDLVNLQYLALTGNSIVCNCISRDFINLAAINELDNSYGLINGTDSNTESSLEGFHTGYRDFNEIIKKRQPVHDEELLIDDGSIYNSSFVLLDFTPSSYSCVSIPESKSMPLKETMSCSRGNNQDYDLKISKSRNKLYLLLILPFLLIILVFIYTFRKNFRYFLITVRNSAMLSLINKNDVLNDGVLFHYDVFVSYCNEDRNWVLDNLLPKLESEYVVTACLHERDFQVGNSILENIVSCMDRSRSIMLIISHKFLLSKWCQFEMHLAQHRLLETRREDLTLILLEEIPRRLRPNTLHYLMLTKTYIIWPKEENERELFWKRLKKTLVAIKMRPNSVEDVSLA